MHTYLEKIDRRKNVARYYLMNVSPSLFGEWLLERQWGRLGQGGRSRLDWYLNRHDAEAALVDLETRKRKRGYFVEPQQLDLFPS